MLRLGYLLPVFLLIFAGLILVGGQPERRYHGNTCQYQVIYGDDAALGLVAIGGSRMLAAANASELDSIIASRNPNASPSANIAHSYYSVEKEYVLLRDLLSERPVKTALVMLEPRGNSFGSLHSEYSPIAKLSDIPLTVSAAFQEAPARVLAGIWDIINAHFKPWYALETALAPRVFDVDPTPLDCAPTDYRLNIVALNNAEQRYQARRGQPLEWDLDAPEEQAVLTWVRASQAIADQHDTALFFILMTGTSEYLPDSALPEIFRQKTGSELIVFDAQIHQQLASDGKRDSSHINAAGRDIFLPWLVDQIAKNCPRQDGCF